MAKYLQTHKDLVKDFEICRKRALKLQDFPGRGTGVICAGGQGIDKNQVVAVYTGGISFASGSIITDTHTIEVGYRVAPRRDGLEYVLVNGLKGPTQDNVVKKRPYYLQYFNHRCQSPNCHMTYEKCFRDDKQILGYSKALTLRKILNGEELTVNYGGAVVMSKKEFKDKRNKLKI